MIDPPTPFSLVPKIQAGSGRIALRAQGRSVAFSELSAAYPLKLLSPRTIHDKVAVVYVLTYGGGLVGGDQLKLCVNTEGEVVLVLLSQVSRHHILTSVLLTESRTTGFHKSI
jgi:urease accessory protein